MRCSLRQMWIAPVAAALDRIIKHIVSVSVPGHSRTMIPGVISLVPVENRGAAFSIFSNSSVGVTILSFLLISALIAWLIGGKWTEKDKASISGLWLIVGGGIGNLYDRLIQGSVYDFLHLDFIHFATFNFADICIVAGAFFVVIGMLKAGLNKESGK